MLTSYVCILGIMNISLELANNLKKKNIEVIPGWKLWSKCNRTAIEKCSTSRESEISSQNEIEIEIEIEVNTKTKINRSLESLGISPVKLKSVPQHQRPSVAKKKYQKVVSNLSNDISPIYNVEMTSLIEDNKPTSSNSDIQKTHDLEDIPQKYKY